MTSAREEDRWMRQALRLARKGYTPPNPRVGCVLVRDGEVVGEGYHPYAGQPHAEVFALQAAGEKARGATAYVTLEPCCHYGKTPPCTNALIEAGVGRVVVAALDSDVRVAGKGIAQLKQAGIETAVGLRGAESRRLNEDFHHFHQTGMPFITLKAAMTLDGKIATHTGDSYWITGESARRYVHTMRAQSGAVVAGIGTVLKDDPMLTARLPNLPRQPLRVIVDSQLRTPVTAQCVRLAELAPDTVPLLIATTENADPQREALLRQRKVEVVRLPANPLGRVDLQALVTLLAKRNIISLFVEGGGELHAGFLEAKLAHKVFFFIAPKLLGGADAPTPLEGRGVALMGEATPLHELKVHRFQQDIGIEGYLPYYQPTA
jgi:diaminohydroxyphosphoribosylaminopyrimidine deaminase/5-amino-6-(5-phosphoribosylamino)uracil reductase